VQPNAPVPLVVMVEVLKEPTAHDTGVISSALKLTVAAELTENPVPFTVNAAPMGP